MNLKLMLIISCVLFVVGIGLGIYGSGVSKDPIPLIMGVGMGIAMMPYYFWLFCSNSVSHKIRPGRVTGVLHSLILMGGCIMMFVAFTLFGFIFTAESSSPVATYFELALIAFPVSMLLLIILCAAVSYKVVQAEDRPPANRYPETLILAIFHFYAPIGMFFIYKRLSKLNSSKIGSYETNQPYSSVHRN